MSAAEVALTQFGFTWGVAEVRRLAEFPDGTIVIEVKTQYGKPIDVYVSPRGRSVRAFRRGYELVEKATP